MVKYSGLERHKKYHFRIVYQKAYENGKKMMFDVRNRYSFAKTIPNRLKKVHGINKMHELIFLFISINKCKIFFS